jgi:ABC-type nitrate/sulfonate/bicarbonate transport system substrate-binding protein
LETRVDAFTCMLRPSEPGTVARPDMSGREGFACPNAKCMCKECTCGEGCTCNVPDAAEPVSCDPCVDFKKAKMAAAAGTIKVGGVPEHFNLPWKMATEQGLWAKHGAPEVEFVEVKGGTGAMIRGLRDKEYDIIIALTECLIAEIEKADGVRLIANYVDSPLVWGVSVGGASPIISLDELDGANFAISRLGSGSHTMAFVMAQQRGWTKPLEFTVCNDFATMREKVNSGECQALMWERFITKPFVDAGELKAIDGVPTPWPCFTAAVLTETVEGASDRTAQLSPMLAALEEATTQFKANPDGASLARVQKDFNLNEVDATAWFSGDAAIKQPEVQFTDNHGGKPTLSKKMMEDCRAMLIGSGVLPTPEGDPRDVGSYCAPFTAVVD